jgi:hypothetical protein
VPTEAQVARADQAVMANPCVRGGGLWARQYQYRLNMNGLPFLSLHDRRVVDFVLTGVTNPAKPHVRVLPPSPSLRLIALDGPVPMAGGSYDLSTGRLEMRFCDPNWLRS